MFFTKMSVFLPSKDPPEKFKRAVARSGAFSFLESAKPDRLLDNLYHFLSLLSGHFSNKFNWLAMARSSDASGVSVSN